MSRLHKHAASNCGFVFGCERPCTASGLVRHVKHGAEGVKSPAAQHANNFPCERQCLSSGVLDAFRAVSRWKGGKGSKVLAEQADSPAEGWG